MRRSSPRDLALIALRAGSTRPEHVVRLPSSPGGAPTISRRSRSTLPSTCETAMTYNEAAEPLGRRDKGVQITNGHTALIERLRSGSAGYRFPGTPQLTPPSPWTTFTVSMRVPWLAARRSWQLQHQLQPPTMRFLRDRPVQARPARTSAPLWRLAQQQPRKNSAGTHSPPTTNASLRQQVRPCSRPGIANPMTCAATKTSARAGLNTSSTTLSAPCPDGHRPSPTPSPTPTG